MTYNVFGGTLSLTQPSQWVHGARKCYVCCMRTFIVSLQYSVDLILHWTLDTGRG